jgi:hypothetical protein
LIPHELRLAGIFSRISKTSTGFATASGDFIAHPDFTQIQMKKYDMQ